MFIAIIQQQDNSIESIAFGPHIYCVEHLQRWLEAHPPAESAHAYVCEVWTEVILEPGMGAYAVPYNPRGHKE